MPTLVLLAWSPDARFQTAERDALHRHGGTVVIEPPGLAWFNGAADALEAAVEWQEHQHPDPTTALAVTVAEVDRMSNLALSPAARWAAHQAQRHRAGHVVAADIVRMLLPEPVLGRWQPIPGAAEHQLGWQRRSGHPPVTVVVAEDVPIIRAGIVSVLRDGGMTVVGQAHDLPSVVDAVRASRPALLVTDIRMPPGQGDEGLRAAALLRVEQPDLAVLVLSQFASASVAADLMAGQTSGLGYLLKERVADLDEFLGAARAVADGATIVDELITAELLSRPATADRFSELAERERAVLELMAQGLSNGAIADRFALSERTVESHVRSIMTKLDLWEDPNGNRRVQAVIRWLGQYPPSPHPGAR